MRSNEYRYGVFDENVLRGDSRALFRDNLLTNNVANYRFSVYRSVRNRTIVIWYLFARLYYS